MTVFYRKVAGGYALSTEYSDELIYRGTLEDAIKNYQNQFGVNVTRRIKLHC